MSKNLTSWDVSAVVWHDACTAIEDPDQGTVPTISLGIAVPDKRRKIVRVVHDLSALHGGHPGSHTAIHKAGMSVRVVFLATLPIPDEFKEYWDEIK